MKAYHRARLGHPFCLYLDGQEAEAVERELERLDPEDFPALAKVERYLARVRGAVIE
ncbi:hypothetical protein ACFTZI_19200 [Streptomyces decoyicus]|uniref:hypothetical protein n=1 Tax=Streptomyces decoyicus TaxID=249567 RepID=UPI00363EF42D